MLPHSLNRGGPGQGGRRVRNPPPTARATGQFMTPALPVASIVPGHLSLETGRAGALGEQPAQSDPCRRSAVLLHPLGDVPFSQPHTIAPMPCRWLIRSCTHVTEVNANTNRAKAPTPIT